MLKGKMSVQNDIFCKTIYICVMFLVEIIITKSAEQTAGADPSQSNFTNMYNPPFHKNSRNF